MKTRRTFSLLSATLCGLALGATALLAGCGGGGSNGNSGGGGVTGTGTSGTGTSGAGTGNTGGNSPYAGSYQGVYLNTSGQNSPDAGTIAFTVSSNGTAAGTGYDFAGDGSKNNFAGAVNSSGTLTTPLLPSVPLSQNSTTHVFSSSYTESNGTKGVLRVGLAPTSSPLAGSYSGTYSSTGGGQGTENLTISSGGTVTATAIQGGQSLPLSGYVDASNNIYLAYKSGGVPASSMGSLTLTGISLNGTVQESGADGSSNTVTLSLTKQ